MRHLKLSEIKVGDEVVFVDRSLNVGDCQVSSTRSSSQLDGRAGVVVAIDPRTTHDAGCASLAPVVEHPPCDCGFAPGKMITVCLKEQHDSAHTCDGYTPARHGVWARPEHLYSPQLHAEHTAEHTKAKAKNDAGEKRKASAQEIAKRFIGS